MEWNKNKDRNEKIKSLLLQGNSITSIAKDLGCSKGTISYYSNKYGWWHNDETKEKRKKNISKSCKAASIANEEKWGKKRFTVIEEAKKEWSEIKNDSKTSMFLGLYWGEGNKRSGNVGVVNNDPGVIKFCYDFIKENVDNTIDVMVRCYPEQDHQECKEFWEDLLKSKVKTKEKKWLGKKRRSWSKYGICTIRTSNWEFYLRIITWIGLWRAEITNTELNIDCNESIARSGLYSTIEYETKD